MPELRVVEETWLGAPCLSYPDRPATVAHVLDTAVRRGAERVAFVLPDATEVTTGDFAALVAGAVATLRARGLASGDRVALAARNGLELAVAQFACAAGGFVLVGLNTRAAPAQWAYAVGHSRARLALATAAWRDPLREVLDGAAEVEDATELLCATRAPWALPAGLDEGATYAVVYTSGSTGRPKGSQVVHRASVHSALSYQAVLGLQPEERTAVLFPLYYISGMHAHVLPALLAGAASVLIDEATPAEYVDLLAEHRIGWAYAVPSVWQRALRSPRLCADELPGLARLGAGGAPFPAELLAALRARLPRTRLYDVYGLSETHSPATILTDAEFADHAGSVGRPLPCMQARTVSPDGTPTAPGEPGELWLRGALVTTGYLDDPAATAAAIRDGWLATGDVARIDAEGYVWLLDRVKDMVNRGGTKVFSAEVERVLRTHPGVADAAVVAVPDPVAGEAVYAFVVPRAEPAPATSALRALVTREIGDFAAPRFLTVLPELPRNPVGKVDKPALRERARAAVRR